MDEFLYLVRNSQEDPYDLEITDYGKIIADNPNVKQLDRKNNNTTSNAFNKNNDQNNTKNNDKN